MTDTKPPISFKAILFWAVGEKQKSFGRVAIFVLGVWRSLAEMRKFAVGEFLFFREKFFSHGGEFFVLPLAIRQISLSKFSTSCARFFLLSAGFFFLLSVPLF